MLIAKQKRKENIAEYILYLWQLEDLLRALSFDGDKIYSTLIEPLQVKNEKKQEIFFWYVSIANLLHEEGKNANGHINHSSHLIRELNDVHVYLLKSGDEKYKLLFAQAKPNIEAYREKSGNEQSNDIEVCFNALYAKMLLSLRGETISEETENAFKSFSALLAYLAAKFHRFERGEEAYRPDKL
ncbi:MAG: DUF4924 family protein [Prevotellaceae bacterium]|jgi:hypothetical protein|nr:DUF4924 family protein [Prevotellaceae bacterium]